MLREGGCAGEGVGVGTDVEGHADGVEDEGHVQPGVDGAARGWEGGMLLGDVVGHEGGKEGRLHVGPDKASWLMQGLQRERHAQTKIKTKTET